MSCVIIIGSGPAGISAALYTARAGIETTVITKGPGALGKADKIQNYYGFSQPVSGARLERDGIEGARSIGVKFVDAEVVGLTFEDKFNVQTPQGDMKADAVILATGASRSTPPVPGILEFEGRGVSYCAVCDGFFYRGKNVAVIGSGEYALHEAQVLLPLAASVTILSNGEKISAKVPPSIKTGTKKLKSINGGSRVERAEFEDGSTLDIDGVFIACGVAGSSDLKRKTGAQTESDKIIVDKDMATNVPGLYAAGDCTGGLLQIAKAVYEGAQAGTSAIKMLRRSKNAV